MENRHAIRVRNIVAAIWAGFGVPTACIWVLLSDRNDWPDRHPVIAVVIGATFIAPVVFICWLEARRRRLKFRSSR